MGIPEDLNLLDRNIDQLKHDYEQFFMGVNKIPPFTLRTAVDRLIRKYASVGITNAGLRFRYQNVVARYNSLAELWNRRMRMKEEGITIGAPSRAYTGFDSGASAPKPPDEPGEPGASADSSRAAASSSQAKRPSRPAGVPAAGDFSATTREPEKESDVVRKLYSEYVRAQEGSGTARKNVSEEGFRNLIIKQVSAIKKSYKCSGVNFSIKMEDGEVKLKAKPIK